MTIDKKLYITLAGFAVLMLFIAFIQWFLSKLVVFNPFTGQPLYTELGLFFFVCILAPLWEELAFRYAPLQIAKSLKKNNIDVTIPIIVISSCLFGWGHGLGPISILIQGVAGLILSAVYLITNSYWSSTLVHFLWNFSLMYIFPILAGQYGIKIW